MSRPKVPTPDQVVRELGGQGRSARGKAAEALGMTRQNVGVWCRSGRIPPVAYFRLAAVRPAKWGHLVS